MRKILLSIFLLMLVSVVACQQAAKKETTGQDAMEKTKTITTPQPDATGNAAVDAVGSGLNKANADENDLGVDNLGDLDSGFSDVQNI